MVVVAIIVEVVVEYNKGVGSVVVANLFCIPGACRSPGGIISDFPAPSVISSLILEMVLGPTTPMDWMPYLSWSFLMAISVRMPKKPVICFSG